MLLFIAISSLVLSLAAVQTFIAQKAVGFLKDEYGINAKIERLQFKMPNKFELRGIYVPDDKNDTLIYAQELNIVYAGFSSEKSQLNIQKVEMNNARLYMRKYPEDSVFNFLVFLNKFSSGEPSKESEPFKLKIGKVSISQFGYMKRRIGCVDSCTNLMLKNANLKVDDFYLNDQFVSARINHMSYTDEQRFNLFEFQGEAAYQAKHISLRDFYIKTTDSELEGDVQLLYDSPRDLSDFLEKVKMEGSFNKSTISSNEFISYIPQFPQFDIFTFSGEVDGTINAFKVENSVINMGNRTRFFGTVEMRNPSDANKLHISAQVGKLFTTPEEYRKYAGQFTGDMDWMNLLDKFDHFEYRGRYNGTVKDFDVKGRLALDENQVVVDGRMNGFDDLTTTTYQGKLDATRLNLNKLFPDNDLGFVKFKASVNGKGLTGEAIAADVDGQVDFMDFRGYRYQNLKLDGVIKDRQFDGIAILNDKNAKLDFSGFVDFGSDTLKGDFVAKLAEADLTALGFSKKSVAILNMHSDINYKIFEDSWWDGTIDVYDITYESPSRFYFFDTVRVVSTNQENYHTDIVQSNLLKAQLEGDYSIADVAKAFQAEYSSFNRIEKLNYEKPDINFKYDVSLYNTELITELLIAELYIEAESRIYGEYASDRDYFKMNLLSDHISWKKLRFYKIDVLAEEKDSLFGIKASIGSFNTSDQFVDSIKITADLQGDSMWFASRGIYRDSIDSYFRAKGYAFDIGTKELEEYTLHIEEGRFNVGNNYFDFSNENLIHFHPNGEVELKNVGFYDQKSFVALNGFYSTDPTKILRVEAKNLSADLLNYAIRYPQLTLNGTLDGNIVISKGENSPKFASELLVDSLTINDDYLGKTSVISDWELETGVVNFNANIVRKKLKMLNTVGSYYPDSSNFIDFDITFDRFRLMWLDPFLTGVLENVRGMATGKTRVYGFPDNIITTGQIELLKAAVGVPYFETDYGFEGKPILKIEDDKIIIPKSTLRDTKEGTVGQLYGEITHDNFRDWKFDLKLNTSNLLALDTENSREAYFYGKGYVAGGVELSGPINDLSIDVDITTQKGTKFKIPFANPVNIGSNDFITYVGSGSSQTIIIDTEKLDDELRPLGGLDISIKAKITPDALIELIMDETVGDIIRGRGMGNLRIEVPHDGDIEMYGTVEVVSGDYLFTMGNIINKKFVTLPGGTLSWNGSPYEAIMNMKAVYTTRTTLNGIVTNNYEGQRVQVDLIMQLDGQVTNPNINFEIDLPNSQASWQEELDNRLSDPDKLNYQAFSLLLINTFWDEDIRSDGSSSASYLGQGAGSNTMQMASAQFTNWLAQGVGDYVDISVGYTTATNDQVTDEVEVDISKDFFNDRITINSRLDVPVGAGGAGANSQSLTGDIEVVYKITKDGRIRAKAFNRSNQDNPALDKLSPYSQGVGVFYQTDFYTYGQLVRKIFGFKPKNDPAKKEEEPTSAKED